MDKDFNKPQEREAGGGFGFKMAEAKGAEELVEKTEQNDQIDEKTPSQTEQNVEKVNETPVATSEPGNELDAALGDNEPTGDDVATDDASGAPGDDSEDHASDGESAPDVSEDTPDGEDGDLPQG